ncbi:hypothetical protein [Streptomyces sp. NPDC002619]|uniref:hypothetical protein n=1 Tax=Streptomyces sp. NPDC002619 TaxID=3364655 RepID=UPI0036AE2A2E
MFVPATPVRRAWGLLAAFLVLVLPFVLLGAVSVDERMARTAIVVLGVIGYGALLTTFSRAGFVAGAAGLLVLAAAYWLAPRLADRAQRRLAAGVAARFTLPRDAQGAP